MTAESKVDRFIDEVLFEGQLAVAFHGYTTYAADDQLMVVKKYQESLKALFSTIPKDAPEELSAVLTHYVQYMSGAKNHQNLKLLISLLEYGVSNNFVSPRIVCETLLKCESLVYYNEDFWCLSFMLIDIIIHGIDYKGVRDLLKSILDKAHSIKSAYNVAVMNQLRSVQQVLETIFDRNACLLPSYLILDELQKKLPTQGSYPHWKFSNLVSSFIDSFRPTAQMVSISVFMEIKGEDTSYGRSKILPIIGHSSTNGNVWKLDPVTAKAPLKGLLPYNKELLSPQTSLLRYVLEQQYSRELVCNMLGVSKVQQKQRCLVLEEQLVELLVTAMERAENEVECMEDGQAQMLWQHLSSQLIYFALFQYASFPDVILLLQQKLSGRNLRKGRDNLMWVLLQFISGSIKKNLLNDFLPVMKLYDLLYPDKDFLPIPDVAKSISTHCFASTSIWIHLMRKAQEEQVNLQRRIPPALTTQLEYLQSCLTDNNLPHTLSSNYKISLLCNAYSTTQEGFTRPMGILVEALQGTKQQPMATAGSISGPIKPLSMSLLDSLTVHTKMSLIHNVVSYVKKQALLKTSGSLSPALVETYSRLLVYSEIEALGIRNFVTDLLPVVRISHAWGILHTLLEMLSYRLHHSQANYRVQLLNYLYSLAAVPQTNQTQLHLCVESTALKLIVGMGSAEVQPQLSRLPSGPKSLLSNESEELNKVLVLTIARAIKVTGTESLSGTWCKEILTAIMQHTPHSWSSFTLKCFPNVLAEFFNLHQAPKENLAQLKRSVEEEYRKWKTMSNENDIISHFSRQGSSPLFLCLLWKMLLDNDRISAISYQILDRIGARALSAHLRTFADFLVYEFAISAAGQHVSKYIDALNDLIWKCHVIQLDRLILCLALRSFEGNEAQVAFLIIQMLLLRPQEFKSRAYDFVKDNTPEHWEQSDWHEKHLLFHRIYPEKFYFEGLHGQHTYLPVYFGNVCLRFLPVMDIVIHRFLELPNVIMVEKLLESLGCLYKFHDRPLTYLYNTLHYYEYKMRERPPLKKKLVSAIVGSLKDIRPENWALSDCYLAYINENSDELNWIPDHDYYVKLINRLVDTLAGKSPFPYTDWRFKEFPNQAAHALHVTCIELMALPVSSISVGNALIDVVLKGRTATLQTNIVAWMNAVGLVLTALPEAYWGVLNDRIVDVMQHPMLLAPSPSVDPFLMFDFAGSFNSMTELSFSYVIALTHSVWYHASVGQICALSQILREKFKPVVKTEEQFLFVCHLVSPFLQRLTMDKTIYAMEITVELYEMLESIDKYCEELHYIDAICDLLYHIKYMFVGDSIKNELEKSIRNLRPSIQRKLRFITHLKSDAMDTS